MTTTTLRTGPFWSVDQIKQTNARLGHYWFTPEAMRFFDSRILSRVYGGRLFVSSERFDDESPRRYTIRAVANDGSVSTVGAFQQYGSRREAITAAEGMEESMLAVWRLED